MFDLVESTVIFIMAMTSVTIITTLVQVTVNKIQFEYLLPRTVTSLLDNQLIKTVFLLRSRKDTPKSVGMAPDEWYLLVQLIDRICFVSFAVVVLIY